MVRVQERAQHRKQQRSNARKRQGGEQKDYLTAAVPTVHLLHQPLGGPDGLGRIVADRVRRSSHLLVQVVRLLAELWAPWTQEGEGRQGRKERSQPKRADEQGRGKWALTSCTRPMLLAASASNSSPVVKYLELAEMPIFSCRQHTGNQPHGI